MSNFKLGATIFASLALAALVWASEADELREQAREMHREAAELAQRGHREEAEQLERKAVAMLEEAEHLERHRPDRGGAAIMELEQRLEALRMEERELEEIGGREERLVDVRHEAERIERELRELSRERGRGPAGPHEEISQRLEHMRIAVEHLRHAGLHDVAEHVAERAEATEQELHARHRHHEGDPIREIMQQLDEIRHEMGRLRDELRELREQR